ncbi:TY1B-DR3, partial [Symbiodinium necroappetens]
VMKSDFFAYKDGRNVTLEKLQECLAMSLNRCNLPGDEATDGWSMHLVVHKGDWKFRREPNSDKPWLDPCRERFNNDADLAAAAQTRVGDIWPHSCKVWLRSVRGFSPLSECADILHALWLGTARDCVASIILDLVAKWPALQHLPTWDERLETLTADVRHWCVQNGIRPSTIETISILVCFVTVELLCSLRFPCFA